ncbi:hypothetical protein FA95DRAFT_1071608 [Auriscalpium vulgare]|uniref:Uncharacterized protein n=1 Tax=Auriscalpium vulgare TaxID=40419 RepID=A0ACB8RX25_9AGAM|nr:hypothetical protein FA95DRAFT_1071608 [Auriscalpium vulgare]
MSPKSVVSERTNRYNTRSARVEGKSQDSGTSPISRIPRKRGRDSGEAGEEVAPRGKTSRTTGPVNKDKGKKRKGKKRADVATQTDEEDVFALPSNQSAASSSMPTLPQPPRKEQLLLDEHRQIHKELWDNGNWRTIFQEIKVVRDETCPHISVPESCPVMKLKVGTGLMPTALDSILIRREHIQVLEDALTCCRRGAEKAEQESFRTEGTDDKTPPTLSDVERLIGLMRDAPAWRGGMCLTGHPGIGKTVMLLLTLHLRVLAGVSTVWQSHPGHLFYYDKTGVEQFHLSEGHSFRWMSAETWCLLDSNKALVDVPLCLQDVDCFIFQAPSPRSERMQWLKKRPLACIYVMKPWTLIETITGQCCRKEDRRKPEETIEYFFRKFAPSVHVLYGLNSLDAYARAVSRMAQNVTLDSLEALLRMATVYNHSLKENDIFQHVMLIEPGTFRDEVVANIPTAHLAHVLEDELALKEIVEKERLFQMFMNHMKVSAGYILEYYGRDMIKAGGSWPIWIFAVTAYPHWRSEVDERSSKPDAYLNVGRTGVSIDELPRPSTGGPGEHTNLAEDTIELSAGIYYIPASASEATFNSLFFDPRSGLATIIQFAGKTQDVNRQGLQWLKDHGVLTVRSITLVPDGLDVNFVATKADATQPGPSLSAEPDLHEMIKEYWVLPVKSLVGGKTCAS